MSAHVDRGRRGVAAPPPNTPGLVEIGGLLQRLTIVIGFTWPAVFGAAMLVNRRDLG